MCSIGGFISNKPLDRDIARHLASALLFYGQDRGNQSAGAFTIGVNKRLAKRAASPSNFIQRTEFGELFTDNVYCALTHTRMPTSGDRGDKQAQPFMQKSTVSVHNGFYFDISGIKEQWKLRKASGVDSELITDFVEEYGVSRLNEFLSTTDGPSAIAVYHKGHLYLAREDNPIHYCRFKVNGTKVLVFGSTYSQVCAAVQYTVLWDDPTITELPANKVFEVTPKRLIKRQEFKTTDIASSYGANYYTDLNWGEVDSLRSLAAPAHDGKTSTAHTPYPEGHCIVCGLDKDASHGSLIIRNASTWCTDCWKEYGFYDTLEANANRSKEEK